MKTPYKLPKSQPYSADKVRALFKQAGVPISEWAKANNYCVTKVYLVLNGALKGTRGVAHEIALKLGLKVLPDKEAA